MAKGGRRPNAGRKAGIKNKATQEREQRMLDDLRGKAARLTPQVWGKDALEDMIPEAQELARVVKGVVRQLHIRAYAELEALQASTMTATPMLDKMKDWVALLKDVGATGSLIAARAGDFQSPKLQRIAVGIGVFGAGGAQTAPTPADNVVQINDPKASARVYLQLVKGAA